MTPLFSEYTQAEGTLMFGGETSPPFYHTDTKQKD